MLREVIGRPISVTITTLVLVVVGFFSLLRLPVSLLPTLERPRLVLTAVDGDRPREELQQRLVEPLERRLLSVPGVLDVHSTIDDGECHIVLESEWQTDVDRLRIDVERRLGDAAALELDRLSVRMEAGERTPILEIAVLGGRSAHRRTLFVDEVLSPEVGRLEGAGRLRRLGGAEKRPVVRPLAAALAARGLTAADVVDRLREVGETRPAGRLRDGGKIRPLVWQESLEDLEALRRIRLGPRNAVLGDVAQITVEEVPSESVFRLGGHEGVLLEVHRAPGANAVRLAWEVRRLLREVQRRAEPGLEIQILHDASQEVTESLRQLALAAGVGLVLGALVLRFALGSWRPTWALVVVVPASVISAFSGFYLWNVSLDIVSLAGLALAAGMLVDNSIVVLEAIERARSKGRAEAEVVGSRQIATALVASFLTTAVVFLPLIYLQGLARAFFGVQAFAIVTTLAISLLLSLSLTPVLVRRLGPKTTEGVSDRGRSLGSVTYIEGLRWALAHPRTVVFLGLLLVAGAASLLPRLEKELMPTGTTRSLRFDFRLPAGMETRAVSDRLAHLEGAVAESGIDLSRVSAVYRGRGDDASEEFDEVERGRLEIDFSSPEELSVGWGSLEQRLAGVPGVEGALAPRASGLAAAIQRGAGGLEVELTAISDRRVQDLAQRFRKHLDTRFGLPSEISRTARVRPAWQLQWDETRLARLGLDSQPLAAQVQAALGGFQAGRLDLLQVSPEILVESTLPKDLRLLPVAVKEGEEDRRIVPLAAVARVHEDTLPPPLERRNGRPALRLSIPGGLASVGRLEEALATFPRSVDEGARLSGQAWEMQRSFGQLRLALSLALVLVFLTVAAIYESFGIPLVVMTTVPVAVAGALGALFFTGQSLNVMSFLGLILLAGIVVNNAIVLVHRVGQRREGGKDLEEAILLAAEERYRPILMTTLTTLLGMAPLAMLGGEGQELRQALALAVSGGLLTSFLAALVGVPVLYRALGSKGSAGEGTR